MFEPDGSRHAAGAAVLRTAPAAWRCSPASRSWRRRSEGIYAALEAADIHATIGAAALVFLVSTLVQLFPFVPGNIGLFQSAVA